MLSVTVIYDILRDGIGTTPIVLVSVWLLLPLVVYWIWLIVRPSRPSYHPQDPHQEGDRETLTVSGQTWTYSPSP